MDSLRTRIVTAQDRATVVLFHSSASSARQWDALVRELEPRFRVCAIDLHGHGARPPWSGAAPLKLADDAALAAPCLADGGPVHLVGHSYGAAVAIKLATMYPGRVRSLVAYEPTLFRLLFDDTLSQTQARSVLAAANAMRMRLAYDDAVSAAQVFVDFWSGSGTWAALPSGRQSAVAARMPTVMRHFDALFGETLAPPTLHAHEIASLVLTGERTIGATRRVAELLRGQVRCATHETLPAMAHMGPITHADEVNRRIVAHLDAHSDRHAWRVAPDSPAFDALVP